MFSLTAQANGPAQEEGKGQQEPEGADEMSSSRLRPRQGPLQAPRPTVAPAHETAGADLFLRVHFPSLGATHEYLVNKYLVEVVFKRQAKYMELLARRTFIKMLSI